MAALEFSLYFLFLIDFKFLQRDWFPGTCDLPGLYGLWSFIRGFSMPFMKGKEEGRNESLVR